MTLQVIDKVVYPDNEGGRALVKVYGVEYSVQWSPLTLNIFGTKQTNLKEWKRNSHLKIIKEWLSQTA